MVEQDEREEGLRAILNFGHTVGHALEALTQYKTYTHGEAIALGMVSAALIGEEVGVTRPEDTASLTALLRAAGFAVAIGPAAFGGRDRALAGLGQKKRRRLGPFCADGRTWPRDARPSRSRSRHSPRFGAAAEIGNMTEKPPLWADLLLTLWVIVVAVFFFGGYFLPAQIGVYTQAGAAFYALMLLVSVGTLAWNYLHRPGAEKTEPKKDTRAKNRK